MEVWKYGSMAASQRKLKEAAVEYGKGGPIRHSPQIPYRRSTGRAATRRRLCQARSHTGDLDALRNEAKNRETHLMSSRHESSTRPRRSFAGKRPGISMRWYPPVKAARLIKDF